MKSLNFGCGITYIKGFDNVDKQDFDFNKFPYPIKNNTYEYVYVRDVLEHLDNPIKVLEELHRITKKNGVIYCIVPYYNSAGAFNSLEHKHYFNRNSFKCLDKDFKGNKPIHKDLVVNRIIMKPTKLGMLIPKGLREKASFVLGEVYESIECQMVCV